MDDSSDILGGQLRVARNDPVLALPDFSFTRLFVAASIAIVFSYGLTLLLPYYRLYQEKRYRKAIRRRHGIPDNDLRPFNVAYAAAKRSEKELEPEDKGSKRRGRAPLVPQAALNAAQQRNGEAAPGIRQRQQATVNYADLQADDENVLPGSHPAYSHSRRASDHTTTASESDFYIPGGSQDNQNSNNLTSNVSASSLYTPAFARSAPHGAQGDDEGALETVHGKHAREEDDMDVENEQEAKKSRIDGGYRLADSDDQGEAQGSDEDEEAGNNMDVDEASPVQPKRGAKRMASIDEDEGFESGRAGGREKRARKVSSRESVLRATRGKKRDRAEAGSTFGGDDLAAEDEEDQHRSHRRRRVVSTKKAASNLRGRKRGREIESPDSADDSDSPSKRAVRQKRGKRNPRVDEWTSSDDGMVSTDPLCKGRRIGEEWQTNGVKFKVGPNGQRLRQALVKKPRSRFPMPKDSEHPDRDVNIEVFVEAWLSEEEYQSAKERRELAWQSPQNTAIELPTVALGEVPESPSKGKSLLWSSVAGKELPRPVSRPSLTSSTSARLNPFQQSPSLAVRRISILSAAPTPPETPTKLQRSRTYSKWEKQDLEAAAMTKLREKTKLDSEPEKKPLTASASAPAFSFPSTSSSAACTTTTTDKPAETSTTEKVNTAPKSGSWTFGAPPSAPITKASTSDLPSLTIPNSAPKSTLPAKPSTVPFPSSSASTASTEPPKPSAPAPGSFSFGAPATGPPAAATTTSSTSVPNFFAKPAAATPAASSSTPAPSTSLFGPSGQPNPQATKAIFSFTGPAANTAAADNNKKAEEKPAQPTGGSLLSRLGPPPANPAPFTAPASQPTSSFFAKPAAPASAPATSTAASSAQPAVPFKFNFGVKPATTTTTSAASSSDASQSTPAADSSKPTSVFGSPTPSTATSAAPKEGSKVVVGFQTQPASGAAPTSSIFGQKGTLGSGAQGTASFFGGTGTSSVFGAPAAAKDATSAPKSAFAPSSFPTTPPNNSTGSVFGKATTTPSGTPATGSVFGTTTPAGTPSSSSLFGAVTPATGSSAFGTTTPLGTPSSGSVFGTTTPAGTPSTNIFGAAATTTPAGAPPKSTFAFDHGTPKPIAAPVFGQPSNAEANASAAPKSVFPVTPPTAATGDSTSTDAASSSTAPSQPKFSFGFTGPTSSSFASAAASGKSVFGATSTPSAAPSPFGASSNVFGGAASSGASGSSEQKPTPAMFGFPSTTGSTTPSQFTWPKPAEQNEVNHTLCIPPFLSQPIFTPTCSWLSCISCTVTSTFKSPALTAGIPWITSLFALPRLRTQRNPFTLFTETCLFTYTNPRRPPNLRATCPARRPTLFNPLYHPPHHTTLNDTDIRTAENCSMLSATDVNLTPRRPRPPAKLRRESKARSGTPPLPALQLGNLDSEHPPPPPYDEPDGEDTQGKPMPALEEWMHDRSREELSDLLLAAGGMIKERESELGMTSTLCKNLYQENVSLKTKHEALLARIPIPTQAAAAAAPSPLPSPTRSLSPLPPGSPHYYSLSRPASPTMSPFSSMSSPGIRRLGHARRISVTPSELTVLADQNAELMHKLERLEEESTQADLRGKKKLRKLEKEISLLREELERTRERGNELEEKVLGVVQKVAEDESEGDRKRREREERVRALRGTKAEDKEAGHVKDFAPAPELSRTHRSTHPPSKLALSTTSEDESTLSSISATSSTAVTPSSTAETFTLPQNLAPQSLEYAIISQLMGKIHELEVTNTQISAEQQATAERLQAAQKDVDHIRRAYECLDESEELCVVAEDEGFDDYTDPASPVSPPKRIPTGQTIRFSSLRRNLDGDASHLAGAYPPSDVFDNGVLRQSTSRSVFDYFGDVSIEDEDMKLKKAAPKARKTVVGLFASTSNIPQAQSDLSPIAMPGNLADVSGWSNAATDGLAVPRPSTSPTDSELSGSASPSVYSSPMPGGLDFPMSPAPAQSSFPSSSLMHSRSFSQLSYTVPSPSLSSLEVPLTGRLLHSLGSELGSEYEYGYGVHALSDVGDIDEDREDTGSVAEGGAFDEQGPSNIWDLRRRAVSGTTVVGSSRSIASDDDFLVSTPTKPRSHFPRDPYTSDEGSSRGPRVVVQPPTPNTNRYLGKGKGRGGLGEDKLEKYNRNTRLSMTVRARTNRWVERRYADRGSGSIDIPETIPDAGPVAFPSTTSNTVAFPASSATPETHQQPRRRRSLMSLSTGMGVHRAVKNVAGADMRRVSSGGGYVRERKRTMDETFEEAVHRVSRSISFSGGRDGFDFEANVISRRAGTRGGGSDGERTPSKLQRFTFPPPKLRMPEQHSQQHKAQPSVTLPKKDEGGAQPRGFVGFILEIWLWLQFSIVIMVFLWAMARRGPKSVLEDAERTVTRRRA